MPIARFDQFLERLSQAAGIGSQTALADVLGVNRSAITQARKKDAIPSKWLLQIYRTYGLNPDWLEKGEGQTFIDSSHSPIGQTEAFRQIPKVKARLCAGDGSFEVESEIDSFFSFRAAWLQRKGTAAHMVLMDVFGNSMEPEIRDGDTVLIDKSQKDILAGAIYAVGIEDTIMVKRLEKHPQALVLISDNTSYAPIHLKKEDMNTVRIIGKVVWICRELC
ncbi:MAG: S24 family peptidase [Desulfobacterales bacterium]|nr:S24 family peptidase [Desulfobacterales bacterium]